MPSIHADGRWVTDDYYEAKILEEITERGIKAGDLVGDLPDPNATHHHNNELSALNAATTASGKPDRGGGGGGLYRAGGPTTIFGGSGLGPFSDGPLNAVRKSLLTRDGVAEENWMWMMATRVGEANEEWAKQRKEAVKSMQALMGGLAPPAPAPVEEAAVDGADGQPHAKKRKVVQEQPVLGAYEPHSNIIQCMCPQFVALSNFLTLVYESADRSDTQPTACRWEPMPDSAVKRRVLGGTKVGNGAWGLAWIDTVMEFPDPVVADAHKPEAIARRRLWEEVQRAEEAAADVNQ